MMNIVQEGVDESHGVCEVFFQNTRLSSHPLCNSEDVSLLRSGVPPGEGWGAKLMPLLFHPCRQGHLHWVSAGCISVSSND